MLCVVRDNAYGLFVQAKDKAFEYLAIGARKADAIPFGELDHRRGRAGLRNELEPLDDEVIEKSEILFTETLDRLHGRETVDNLHASLLHRAPITGSAGRSIDMWGAVPGQHSHHPQYPSLDLGDKVLPWQHLWLEKFLKTSVSVHLPQPVCSHIGVVLVGRAISAGNALAPQ